MSKHMVWVEEDHFAGWSCSQCIWMLSSFCLDTTVAVLAYNRFAERGFEQHDCMASAEKVQAGAQTAGHRTNPWCHLPTSSAALLSYPGSELDGDSRARDKAPPTTSP
jgi:hypothetical protein